MDGMWAGNPTGPASAAGSTVVTYEYNLSVMPGVDAAKAVAQVDSHIPVRIAQELGIWCDEDAEDRPHHPSPRGPWPGPNVYNVYIVNIVYTVYNVYIVYNLYIV